MLVNGSYSSTQILIQPSPWMHFEASSPLTTLLQTHFGWSLKRSQIEQNAKDPTHRPEVSGTPKAWSKPLAISWVSMKSGPPASPATSPLISWTISPQRLPPPGLPLTTGDAATTCSAEDKGSSKSHCWDLSYLTGISPTVPIPKDYQKKKKKKQVRAKKQRPWII